MKTNPLSQLRRQSSFACTLALVLSIVACRPADGPVEGPVEGPPEQPASADHHLHIQSAMAAEVLDELSAVLEPGSEAGAEPARPYTAADAIAALDQAGIVAGIVLSNSYMFGVPDIEVADELEKVRSENDYVAAQVAEYPERLVGLCSVNPLASYALEEIDRCAADPRLGGLKLHLANSDVDLLNEEHVQTMAMVFRRLEQLSLPVLVHMRTRNPDYGEDDAKAFIDRVLSEAPGIPVQIAHMAGWGGYDDATDAALGAFVTAFEEERLDREQLVFGLGAVVFLPAAAGDNEELAASVRSANQKLAERIRQLGTERVVYATDWPGWPPGGASSAGIEKNLELVRSALPLTETELQEILANVSDVFSFER